MNMQQLFDMITKILPNAEFAWDENNQIIIYTGLTDNENGELTEI